MSVYDVICITMGILNGIEVSGYDNIDAMKKAMDNLNVLKDVFRNAEGGEYDHHDQQG